MNSLFKYDLSFNIENLIGVDEAGRGPLAGPVYAAAVIIKDSPLLFQINDSKTISAKKRETLYSLIIKNATDYAIASVEPEEIEKINIHNASLLCMKRAIDKLTVNWNYILVDGKFTIPEIDSNKQKAIIKGDSKSACIAAASILAKVKRDKLMIEFDKKYPQYEFAKHKGYGTALHIERIREYGLCPIHRKNFCKKILAKK